MLSGNDIQRKWKNIRDDFRNEVQFQKKLTSGQGARKKAKIYLFSSAVVPPADNSRTKHIREFILLHQV
jgi:hypothetical protein